LGNLNIDGRIILICILAHKNVDYFEDKLQSEDFVCSYISLFTDLFINCVGHTDLVMEWRQ